MKTIGLLLAAGHSRRFGPQNKLLADFRGKPLVAHSAEAMRNAGLDGLVAVVTDQAVADHLTGFNLVRPGEADPEQSNSLRTGVQAVLDIGGERLLIGLGDMPLVTAAHLRAVVDRCTPKRASASTDGTRRTPPACFPVSMAGALLTLYGDRGAGSLLQTLPADALVEAQASMLKDVDVVADLD